MYESYLFIFIVFNYSFSILKLPIYFYFFVKKKIIFFNIVQKIILTTGQIFEQN
jgi:hypothetical protein